MTMNPNTTPCVSAFEWVPEFAQGQVRDLRVRWALEEAGIDYSVQLLDAMHERPAEYLAQQPFGQVPAYRDGEVVMFESGAIVLRIGESCEVLMPRDAAGRAMATTWLIAALNTVEPWIQQLAAVDIFHKGEAWAAERRPGLVADIHKRLGRLADRLGDSDWLEGRFTVGDLLMVSVLRGLDGTDLLDSHPTLAAYKARGEARPAFQRALAAQIADFKPETVAA